MADVFHFALAWEIGRVAADVIIGFPIGVACWLLWRGVA